MEKKKHTEEKFYINKKQYIPDESALLCRVEGGDFGLIPQTRRLYRTQEGAFFLVSEGPEMEKKVKIIDSEQAFAFMDEHPACINTDIYVRIFGEPEKG